MTTAVYILSSIDKVDSFASQARELEYDTRKVLVGSMDGDVRPVVFLDGSPTELKSAIVGGKDAKPFLNALKSRVESMLKATRVGQDDLRLFVHFGGQGEDEISKFNKALQSLTVASDSFRCYAISFGNHCPKSLFPDLKFLPPCGDSFFRMCEEVQAGKQEDLEHLRALRLFLPMFKCNDEDRFVMNELDDVLRLAYDDSRLGRVLSDGERAWLAGNQQLMEIFDMTDKDDWCRTPDELSAYEHKFLMSNLLSKGDSK